MTDPIATHITAASQHAHEASQSYANPAISAAVAQRSTEVTFAVRPREETP